MTQQDSAGRAGPGWEGKGREKEVLDTRHGINGQRPEVRDMVAVGGSDKGPRSPPSQGAGAKDP